MEKTEKRTAEEIVSKNNPNEGWPRWVTKKSAIESCEEYAAQELDVYKMKVQQEIKTAYDEMIRIGNIKRDLNVFAIMHQLQIKLK